ncbi:MAG: amino acid permease [Gammaproteobacteria bacterium]|nr:amino acid permease [Gammaproteobacteria bacterium]
MTTESGPTRFGTLGGVFTPCVLTILGVIMFLRFGQVVGEAGLWHGLAIVLGAKLITVLTTFSLSAIATNTRIKGGGAYFLISRSLGVEFGGVIGIVLFLAQAVSVSMYVIGFTEAFVATFPESGLSFRSVATIVNVLTFVCVFIGAGWTIKMQYGILAVLALSLIAFFAGAVPQISLDNLQLNSGPFYSDGQSMFTMFALFFPAVTGIMAGANMSGDLKDPSRSIPLGTLAAVGVTALVYVAMAVVLSAAAPRDALLNDSLIVKTLSVSPALITAGIFAATLSSALGSMMGAPRILQAFGRDDIFRPARFFAAGSGASGEPRRATVLTFIIAQSGIMLGDLNAIAPIITMFFMVTYGTLNLACFYEGISRNPSYRPRFRFSHWSLALLGAIGCGVVMLMMNPLWAVISVFLIGLLYFLISRAEIIARWGDIGSGVAFERARKALLQLEEEYFHPKNWRPAIIALSGGAWSRLHLAEYAHWMAAGHGIVTLAQLMPEVGENQIERRREAEKRLRKFIHEETLSAFPVVVTESRLSAGLESLLQSHGIGGMRPNTVLMGLPNSPEKWDEFCLALHCADRYERSVVLVDCNEDTERWQAPDGSIDILWQGEEHGELMVLLGHLLKKNPEWRTKPLRVLAALPPKGDFERYRASLEELINLARIDASVHVFSAEDLYVTLAKRTGNSAALFVQFDPPAPEEQVDFFEWTAKMAKLVPDIIYVHSARRVSLQA